MSTVTYTKSFQEMSRRQAIDLCYILEEQRDKQIARAEDAEARLAAVAAVLEDQDDAWYPEKVVEKVHAALSDQ